MRSGDRSPPRADDHARTRRGRRGPSARRGPHPGTRTARHTRDAAWLLRPARGRGPFFEAGLCRRVRPWVARAGLLPGEAEGPHQPPHAAFAVGDAEALLGDPAEVDDAPSRDAVALRIWAAQHDGFERRLLALIHPGTTAGAGLVAQARHTFGVEADH